MKKYTGHVILVMAPTGSGKGTLERHAFSVFPELLFSVSCTTRSMRPTEQEGREYYFVSREQFMEKVQNEEFLEWAEFGGNLYGTLKSELIAPLENGQVILNEIELQGIEQIRKIIPAENQTIIYIDAGSWEDMQRRAEDRAPISQDELALRRMRYEHEVAAKPIADIIITNYDGGLEQAKEDFVSAIRDIIEAVQAQ